MAEFIFVYIQVNIILGILLGIYYWLKGSGSTNWGDRLWLVLFPAYGWGNWSYYREVRLGGTVSEKLRKAKIMIRVGVVNGFAILFGLGAIARMIGVATIDGNADNSTEWVFNTGFNVLSYLFSGFVVILLAVILYAIFSWAPIIIGLVRQSSVYKNVKKDAYPLTQ